MKYICYTYVDVKTQAPVSQEPARNGPAHPDGVTPTFAIESSFGPTPVFYGIAEDDFVVKDWMYEMSEEQFFSEFKAELKERARDRRWKVEQSGIVVNDVFVSTTTDSQNRITSMVSAINLNPDMQSVDFESIPGQWTNISRDEGLSIGSAVGKHIQDGFSWCKTLHQKVDDLVLTTDNLADVLPILQEIEDHKAQ